MRTCRLLLSTVALSLGITAAAQTLRTGSMIARSREALAKHQYEQAAATADSILNLSNNQLTRLQAVDILTKAYFSLDMPAKADDAYRQGRDIFMTMKAETEEDRVNVARNLRHFLFNYAQFQLSTGRYDDCIATLDFIDNPISGEETRRIDGLMASALMRKGALRDALNILDRALATEGTDDGDDATVITLQQNRGYIKMLLKDYTGAEKDLRQAVEKTHGIQKEISRANLALTLMLGGKQKEAEKEIDIALMRLKAELGENHSEYIIALRKKAEILQGGGRKKEAASTFRKYFELERTRLIEILPSLDRRQRLSYWTMEKPALSRCFEAGPADPSFAFDVALMRRETSLLGNDDKERTIERLKSGGIEVARKLKECECAVAFVTFPVEEDRSGYAALILTKDGNCRFVELFDDTFIYETPLKGRRSLYDLLLSEDPQDKQTLYTDQTLGERIWLPVMKTLPSNVTTIHFAPEGVMHLWGIENMPFEGKKRYCLKRHFSLLDINPEETEKPEAYSILLAGGIDYDATGDENPKHETKIANHEAYNELTREISRNGKEGIFQYLPGTAMEVDAIAGKLDGVRPRKTLTEEEMKQQGGDYRIIHLATHGYSLDCGLAGGKLPTDSVGYDLTLLRSGIALTGANRFGEKEGREDGILSAREICDMDLKGVDLVVLSACQTAKGLISDENASGLVRALKQAGVRTIVATLWEVDDRSAALFMQNFYEALAKNGDKQQAIDYAWEKTANHLQRTRKRRFDAGALAGRASGETTESCPFASAWYWAPFILIDP